VVCTRILGVLAEIEINRPPGFNDFFAAIGGYYGYE
jgi:hypothetical protein